jgi:hypothetical protein
VNYSTSMIINHAGDGILNYRFYFSDGTNDATGEPTTDHTFTVVATADNAPVLNWTGNAGFETDGVNPDSAASGSNFEFQVKYTDADNDAPTIMQVWVDLASLGGTDYVAGVNYSTSMIINYAGDGILNYRFYFSDGTNDATGDPTTDHTFTVTQTRWGGTCYVSKSGSNTVPYDTWTTAATFIQTAIDYASGNLGVGEVGTVVVAAGTYFENVTMKDAVDLVNNTGDTPIIDGGGTGCAVTLSGPFSIGCTLDGFDVKNGGSNPGIYVHGTGAGVTNTTTINNCSIHGNSGPGIELDGGLALTAPTIDNNNIYGNNQEGISLIYAGSVSHDLTILNNTIYENTLAGINIAGASHVTIGNNNDIYGNYVGVAFDTGGSNPSSAPVRVMGNNIFSNDRGGIYIVDAITDEVTITQNNMYQNIRGGISIQNSCKLVITKNDIHDNVRGGIHTGTDVADGGGFSGSMGSAVLTIRQNKVHNNGGSDYGSGIDVRHASGTIENNLVYENYRGGIRFGWENELDLHITDIRNNTVVSNGNDNNTPEDPTDDRGGGIIYDNLAGAVNDKPEGSPPGKLYIRNNICAYNQKAGLRACFTNTDSSEERDYNLMYSNYEWDSNPDCGWPGDIDMRCINQQYGGCGAHWEYYPTRPVFDYPHDILDDPLFVNITNHNYHLQTGSQARLAGDDGKDMGAYGGTYPIDW